MKRVIVILLAFILGVGSGFVGGLSVTTKKSEMQIIQEVEANLSRLGLTQKEIDSSLVRPQSGGGASTIIDGEFRPFSVGAVAFEMNKGKPTSKGTIEITNNSGYDITALDFYINGTVYETLKRKEKEVILYARGKVSIRAGETGICKINPLKLTNSAVDWMPSDVTVLGFTTKQDGKSQDMYVDYELGKLLVGELPEELKPVVVNED